MTPWSRPLCRRRMGLRQVALGAGACGLALALVGCGGGGDKPAYQPPEQAVRAKVAEFGRASAAKDYDVLCREILAPKLIAQVTSVGLPCTVALRQGLGSVRDPRLTIGAVRVQGDQASAQILSSAAGQEPSRDTLRLLRVKGQWRIASLGA